MSQLLGIFLLSEMARNREAPMWAVLDWAAKNDGDFTIKDAYRVFTAAGGESSLTSFHTMIGHLTAKDWKSDQTDSRGKPYWPPSADRPLVLSRRGRRGKGGAHSLQWGLDGPLREPPADGSHGSNADDEPVAVAMDNLEKFMGAPALKAAMARWRKLGDLGRITADIRASVPRKAQMDAMLVATEPLMSSGKVDQQDVEDAEERLSPGAQEPAQAKATPFAGAKPKANLPRTSLGAARQPPAQEPEPELDDDPAAEWEDAEKTAPDATSPFATGDQETPGDASDDGEGTQATDDDESPSDEEGEDGVVQATLVAQKGDERVPVTVRMDEEDMVWVEDAEGETWGPYAGYNMEVRNGVLTQSMFDALEEDGWTLVAADDSGEQAAADGSKGEAPQEPSEEDSDETDDEEAGDDEDGSPPDYLPEPSEEGSKAESAMFELDDDGFGPDNGIWREIHDSRNSVEAHKLIKASGMSPRLQRYALTVARAIFDNTGRDFETGEKTGRQKRESRLARLFTPLLESSTDDDYVPDPSKRGIVGPTRTLPDYGMDEGPNVDPVDFAQRNGLRRIIRVVRR